MDLFDSTRDPGRIGLIFFNHPSQFIVRALDLAQEFPLASLKLCFDGPQSLVLLSGQIKLLMDPFMAGDFVRPKRDQKRESDKARHDGNQGHNDEHREQLKRSLHRGWVNNVEGKPGASPANTFRPRELWALRTSVSANVRPKVAPIPTVIAKARAPQCGLSKIETRPSTHLSRVGDDLVRIDFQMPALNVFGRFGKARLARFLSSSSNCSSSILTILTPVAFASLEKSSPLGRQPIQRDQRALGAAPSALCTLANGELSAPRAFLLLTGSLRLSAEGLKLQSEPRAKNVDGTECWRSASNALGGIRLLEKSFRSSNRPKNLRRPCSELQIASLPAWCTSPLVPLFSPLSSRTISPRQSP